MKRRGTSTLRPFPFSSWRGVGPAYLRWFLLGVLFLYPVTIGFPMVPPPPPSPETGSRKFYRPPPSGSTGGGRTMQRQVTRKNPDEGITNAEPLYITVGTQCCGKTTFLKEQLPKSPLDISLDDQPDVYVPVDTPLFLRVVAANHHNHDPATETDPRLLRSYHGKTLLERIQHDNTELTLVLQRFHGDLSCDHFAAAILKHFEQTGSSLTLAQLLIDSVEQECSLANTNATIPSLVPSHVQVFVLESLFQPHPTTHQSAIQRAHRLLRQTPSHIPVAWGNTNSKARDYQMALEIACQARRPVRFVLQGRDLPPVSLSQILQRNLQRFSQTGKYIPAVAMDDCQGRISKLLSDATAAAATAAAAATTGVGTTTAANTVDGDSVLAVEQHLVQLAVPPGSQFRYRLTRNRLIQKEVGNTTTTAPRYPRPSTRPSDTPKEGNKRPRWN